MLLNWLTGIIFFSSLFLFPLSHRRGGENVRTGRAEMKSYDGLRQRPGMWPQVPEGLPGKTAFPGLVSFPVSLPDGRTAHSIKQIQRLQVGKWQET